MKVSMLRTTDDILRFWFSKLDCRWQFFNKPLNRSSKFEKLSSLFSNLEAAPLPEVIICNDNLKKKLQCILNIRSEETINLLRFWRQNFKIFLKNFFPLSFVFYYFEKSSVFQVFVSFAQVCPASADKTLLYNFDYFVT